MRISTKLSVVSRQISCILNSKGISLVELLIVISSIGFLALLVASVPNAISLVGKSNYLSIAREIAVKQIEDTRSIGYESLNDGENEINDSRLKSLPQSTGTVIIKDCDASICTHDEELKQVIVHITWKESGKDQEVKMTTFVSENGL